MAAEVHRQDYIFEPGSTPAAKIGKMLSHKFPLLEGDDVLDFQPGDEVGFTPRFAEDLVTAIRSPFCFSPLHDVESLWWLTSYFTFEYSSKLLQILLPNFKLPKEAKGKSRRPDQGYFPTDLFEDHHQRFVIMTSTGYFAQYAYTLPDSIRAAGAALEKFRRELVARYKQTEKTQDSVEHPAFDGLHKMLAETMRTIADVVAKAQTEQKPLASKPKKRSRDECNKGSVQTTADDAKRPRIV